MIDIGGGHSSLPSVYELVRRRHDGLSDDFVLALAVEGGGMRGVVSGAMLIALRDLGLADVFDRFYGTSSGAMNLAYFAAGGGWDALSVYYDHLVKGFVRPSRLAYRTRLDMAYVFDDVMRYRVPLDTAKVAASPYDVRIVLSDVERVRPVVVPLSSVPERIPDFLKAGAWLPVLAGRPHVLDGHRYLDGGLLWPDPLYAALAEGCTHVLTLNTAPENAAENTSPITVQFLRRVLNRWRTGLGDGYVEGRKPWAIDKAILGNGRAVALRGIQAMRLCPAAGAHRVQRLTLSRAELLDGARAGYATVMNGLGSPTHRAYFAVVMGN